MGVRLLGRAMLGQLVAEAINYDFVRTVKVGSGISRTNADSQWNPVYNVFHRNFCCGNETIRR